MKSSRFLLVAVIAFSLLLAPGCATIQAATSPITNFFCHPTPGQVTAANLGRTVAQALLAKVGGGLAALAIPVFDQVIAGWCVLQADWDLAAANLAQANALTKPPVAMSKGFTAKAMAPTSIDREIAVIQAVTW